MTTLALGVACLALVLAWRALKLSRQVEQEIVALDLAVDRLTGDLQRMREREIQRASTNVRRFPVQQAN